jgi:hypothetical protein
MAASVMKACSSAPARGVDARASLRAGLRAMRGALSLASPFRTGRSNSWNVAS